VRDRWTKRSAFCGKLNHRVYRHLVQHAAAHREARNK
jgi:hypothetical protein